MRQLMRFKYTIEAGADGMAIPIAVLRLQMRPTTTVQRPNANKTT